MAAVGLRCGMLLSLVEAREVAAALVAVCGLLTGVAFPFAAHELSSCGAWA